MNKETFFKDSREDCAGPLEGLLVVEAATTWAGPLAAMLLGDHGASVIKVEDAVGDVSRRIPPMLPGTDPPLSFMHATVNRNKRSVSLDLHDAADQDRLLQLLDQARRYVCCDWRARTERVLATRLQVLIQFQDVDDGPYLCPQLNYRNFINYHE